jgi:FPC/CPF motif-containing protein YcgG
MILTEPAHWTSRVLSQGMLGISSKEGWKLQAYEQYRAKVSAPDYPCFFGQSGEARGEMLYTFIPQNSLSEMLTGMQQFTSLISSPEHMRCSLVAFFQPDPSIITHASFVNRFWQVLQYLHGTSPTYRLRRSRNLGLGIGLIFQPRSLFIDPTTLQPIAAHVRKSIHKRMLAYDGMPVHPDIGFYGDLSNREWKQYALPDDNEPETGGCPFRTMQTASR